MDRIVAVGFPIRVCLLVGFLSSCGGTAPDSSAPSTPNARSSPESLLEEVKKAVVSKDIEMLVALGHWEGVPDKYPNVIRRHLTELFDYVDPTYSISTMTPQEKADSKIGNRKFTWNIEPYGGSLSNLNLRQENWDSRFQSASKTASIISRPNLRNENIEGWV